MSIKISGFQVGASFSLPQYGSLPPFYSTNLGSNHGGTGLMQISFDAPANSTTLVFTSQDDGGNIGDMYMQGYTAVAERQNGGATYWQYITISSRDNTTSVTNEIATSVGFVRGNSIVIAETLKGISSVPSLVTTFNQQASTGQVCSFQVEVNPGEIIVLGTAVEIGTAQQIPAGTDLTWIRKSSKSTISSFSNNDVQTMEIWYAINNTGNTIIENVDITMSTFYDDQAAVAATYSGVDLTSPWA